MSIPDAACNDPNYHDAKALREALAQEIEAIPLGGWGFEYRGERIRSIAASIVRGRTPMNGEWESDGGFHCDLPEIPEGVEPGAIWRCECGKRWRVLDGSPNYGWTTV